MVGMFLCDPVQRSMHHFSHTFASALSHARLRMEEVRGPHILSGCTLVRAAGLVLVRKSPALAQAGRLPNASGASPE